MKLEDRIDMGLFGFGNKSKGIAEHFNEHMGARGGVEDPLRREFLKTSMAVGAATMAPGLLVPETAKASEDWVKKLPPGFQISEDRGLQEIMARMRGFVSWTTRKGEVRTTLTLSGWYNGYEPIKRETITKDPAYWFAKDHYNYVYNRNNNEGRIWENNFPIKMDELKSQNLPLYYFALGNQYYFETWVARERNYSRNVEENLLKSIFTAAGKNEREVDEYLKYGDDLNLKTRKLQDVMRNLEKMPYNNQLIAAWSSFFLMRNFGWLNRRDITDMIYHNLEMPLRNLNKDFKIRGSPHYY